MPEIIPDNSVGIVATQTIHFSEALPLVSGKVLNEYDIAYETYGELNAEGRVSLSDQVEVRFGASRFMSSYELLGNFSVYY